MAEYPDVKRLYQSIRQYDDGVIRTVAARKKLEAVELEIAMGDGATRAQESLMTYLREDLVVYETLAYILSMTEEEFAENIGEIGPAMTYEPTPVPRAVLDSYRRGLSDLELRMEDRAAGYADDIMGMLRGECRQYLA